MILERKTTGVSSIQKEPIIRASRGKNKPFPASSIRFCLNSVELPYFANLDIPEIRSLWVKTPKISTTNLGVTSQGLSCFIHRSLRKTLCCFVEILALARLAPQHLDKRPRSWQSLEDNGQDMGSKPSLQNHSPEELLRFSRLLVNKKCLINSNIKKYNDRKKI